MREECSLIHELVLHKFDLFYIASVINFSVYHILLSVPMQNWDDLYEETCNKEGRIFFLIIFSSFSL